MNQEAWRPVPDTDGLEVSTTGKARKNGRELKGTEGAKGYWKHWVVPTDGSKPGREYIHRLIAKAFIGPAPFPGAEVRHLDGDPSNNHPSNLAWGTHHENMLDIDRHGRRRKGERCPAAKLTNSEARMAAEMRKQGKLLREIVAALDHKVKIMTISDLLRGKTFKEVTSGLVATSAGDNRPPVQN